MQQPLLDETDSIPDRENIPTSSASSSRRQRKRPRLSTPSPPSTTRALSPAHAVGSSSGTSAAQDGPFDRNLIDAVIFEHANDSPSPMSLEESEDFADTAAQLAV